MKKSPTFGLNRNVICSIAAKLADANISDDENEYFSSKSSIASDESSGDTISLSSDWRRNITTKNRNINKMPTNQNKPQEHVQAMVHHSGHANECNEPKYGADEMHTNRSRYFNCHTKNEPKNQRRISGQHKVESSRSRGNDFTAMNQENRCCSKAIKQYVVELGTKENRIMKSEHAPQQPQERCAFCDCVKASSSDDTDDVTSSENRDSDTNLLMENLRNRECEMFQKICFNNGYYGSSATNSNYSSDTNSSAVSMVPHEGSKVNRKCPECANPIEKNACRRQRSTSSSVGQQHVASQVSKSKKSKQSYRKNSLGSDRQSNVSEQSRRITITIRTKTVSDAKAATSERMTDRNVHFFNDYETDDSDDTTESEFTTVNDCTKAIADVAFNAPETGENIVDEEPKVRSDEENNSDGDCDDDVEQSKSDSSVFLSMQSEQSQYFDCANESASLSADARQSNSETKPKMRSRENTKSEANMEKKDSPMICITQEMARDRTVTSQVQINRAKVRAFKKRQKELRRPKIIDDSFCDEILNETLKLPSVAEVKRVTVNRPVSICSDEVRAAPVPSTKSNNFISERFSMGSLDASPRYTGKSIGRLLAHRLEQQTMTRVRRTLLQETGIELAIADEKYVMRRKKLEELPPIKPPRSFAATSSSSPLSKESVESSTTIPVEDLKRPDPSYIGFVMPSTSTAESRSRSSTQIGWVRPEPDAKNESRPSQQNSLHFYTAEGESNLVTKEDIDTVDFPSYVSAAQEFESFSANLDDNHGRMNLSTPIKSKSPGERSDRFATVNARSATTPAEPVAVEKRCTKCQGMKKKSSNFLSTKNGRKFGKAALKRTKTLIDSSKQFLMKSRKHKNEKRCVHEGYVCCNAVAVETPVKDPDNTARFNSETFYSCDQAKRANKSLNLTTPQERQPQPSAPQPSAPPVADLNPSPDRNVRRMDTNLLRTVPQTPSTPYATPNASFNFDRVVEAPQSAPNDKTTGKSSPAKLISKLNQIAKNSKTLFRNKEPVQANAKAEAPHYYRSFGGNQIDVSVPLMGETLRSLRDKLETDRRPVPAARKSLFTQKTLAKSLNSEQIADIELHDEPEPIYAIIDIQQTEKTTKNVCSSDDASKPSRSEVRVDEVFVTTREGMPPSKYLMVNNDPKMLYATVNRNAPTTTTPTETQSTDSAARLESCSSYESLDISSIGEFAQSLQQIMDENQLRMRRIYRTVSESGDDDAAVDDLSSGCSSFYRKSRQIAETATESKRWQDFMESLSLGTVQTGSYCESLGRGNDVNGEIKKSIGIVERSANVSGQFSQSDGLSFDCEDDELMQTARLDESGRVRDSSFSFAHCQFHSRNSIYHFTGEEFQSNG